MTPGNKYLDEQVFYSDGKCWRVSRLIFLSSTLPVKKVRLKYLNVSDIFPECHSTTEFVEHMEQVFDADLSYPIILDQEGTIMDGRHRVLKALLKKKKKIPAVKFIKTPDPCYEAKNQ